MFFCLLALVLLAIPAYAVTLDATSSGSTTTTSLTVSHTVTSSGGNRAIAIVCANRVAANTVTATYNGVNVPQAPTVGTVNGTAIGANISAWAFILANPSTGTNNWVVTQSNAVGMLCVAVSATDVDQVTPASDDDGICSSSVTSVSRTLTVASNELIVDGVGRSAADGTLAEGTNQVDISGPIQLNANFTGDGSYKLGSNGTSTSWSWGSAGSACMMAVSFKHSAFSASNAAPFRRRL